MKIVDAIPNRVVNSTDVENPRPDYIARVVNRIREKTRPKDLRGMQFELKTDNLPEGLYRKEVKVGDRRHLIFGTDEN
ncbi:hypothetical protein DPMN_188331 [Dreissena polymorpha]|uniref:Uncharacterized protein n=1 Tax=Dreissena polymorpha TaxID=45954 RepID=A0A9D4DR36_DREPO|nr:hypothetical protein DPMN_188331 [Dreissena polymorpha]